jgi:membrane associated rhomboid family serine protease
MFILLPVGVDYRARRQPVVTFTLMGICTLVYLVTLGFRLSGDSDSVEQWVYEYLWLTPGESHWWTYLTSQFVHGGIMHLAGNMVYLYLFGACVEDTIGRVRFTIFYLLCGVAAAFAHVLVTPDHFASEMPMGGASGAISGCIGGFLLLLAGTRIEFKWAVFFFFRLWNGEFMLPAWLVISFWFLEDLVMMILTALGDGHGRGGGVAFAAHVGGTLFGMGLIAIEKVRLKRIDNQEEALEEAVPVVRPVVRMRTRPQLAPAEVETPTIHLFWDGAESGPFTLSHVQQMFATDGIPADAQYWQEGMDEWRAADELREPGVG